MIEISDRRLLRRTPPSPGVPAASAHSIQAKQDRSRTTHDALLDAFEELLHEGRNADISLAQIARQAGLTTGAVYGRFRDKRGIAIAVYERFAHNSAQIMEEWGRRPTWQVAAPKTIVEGWTKGALNFCRMHRPLMALMSVDPAVQDEYDTLMARPARILKELLQQRVPASDDDIEWAARAALAVLERLDLDEADLNDRLVTLVCNYLGVE